MRITVVTDSTASLPADVVTARGLVVVPLQVVIGSEVHDEGTPDASADRVARALHGTVPVSTSRPPPAAMLEVYRAAAEAGAEAIVSVHLASQMSGTVESAQAAAARAPVPVQVVDSRQVGFATGYAAIAAADAADRGASVEEAANAARARAAGCRSLFYVDTLEHLRRGGRIGSATALVGGALSVKPLLAVEEGVVVTLERVRTSTRALARLADLAVEHAGRRAVDVGVAHLANPDRAADLTDGLRERLAGPLEGRDVWCAELGAVLGAHVGPGMIAVCVAPRPPG